MIGGYSRRVSLPNGDLQVSSLLDEIRSRSGSDVAFLTVLHESHGHQAERVALISAAPSGDLGLPIAIGLEWPWHEGASSALLSVDLTYTPAFTARFPDSRFLAGSRITGVFAFPILAASDDRVIATVTAVSTRDGHLGADVVEHLALLAAAASASVIRDVARTEAEATAAHVDADLMRTLEDVRASQDQVGNSIAVVLGWLRMLADSGSSTTAPGGIQIAIRRLEEAQSSIGELLRRTSVGALRDHANDLVNASAVAQSVGRLPSNEVGPDVWIRANATHLATFLADSAAALDPDAIIAPDAWLVPFLEPGLITTSSLLTLHASGGSVVSHGGRQTARWVRAVPPVTP
jgi:hypothetical protein